MQNKGAKAGQSDQSERFKQAARDLGCDESAEHFDAALKRVARHKTMAQLAPKKKSLRPKVAK